MKILKVCPGEWEFASRDKRELSVYRDDMNCSVQVIAKAKLGADWDVDIIDSYEVHRYTTRPLGDKPYLVNLNRILASVIWIYRIGKEDADILSCHDLPALIIGWLSNFFTSKKKKLIYDAHEFELGRGVDRSRVKKSMIKIMEGFLIKKCAFSIMVNDSIADENIRIYNLEKRPIVVRSTPDYWILDEKEINKTREKICKELGVSTNTFILMYHGGITPQRNIETLIDIVKRNQKTIGVILGNAFSKKYKEELEEYASRVGIRGKIYFHDAVDINELYKYVGASDLGIMLLTAEYRSYYLCLPNKFFENIQALTPMVASNFPEMSALIKKYNIGLTVNPNDLIMIDKAIKKMKDDKSFYNECKHNLIRAKEELCWEKEKEVLIDAFNKYI